LIHSARKAAEDRERAAAEKEEYFTTQINMLELRAKAIAVDRENIKRDTKLLEKQREWLESLREKRELPPQMTDLPLREYRDIASDFARLVAHDPSYSSSPEKKKGPTSTE
jgi:hypothetical protein